MEAKAAADITTAVSDKLRKLAHARRLLGGGSPAPELASAFGRSRRGFRRLAARPSQSPLPWLRVWLGEGGRERLWRRRLGVAA